MPNQSFRVGVPTVQLSVDSSTALPSLSTLVFDASAVSPSAFLNNDVNSNLSTSTTYQVAMCLLGRDIVNGGYTIGPVSPGSGVLSLTSGQIIRIHVSNGNWPANYNLAIAAAIFLKSGSGNFQLADFAYIDTTKDFNYAVMAQPLTSSPTYTYSTLQSNTNDSFLGSRAPYGVTYTTLGPTTQGVSINRDVTTVTISPDNAPDFQLTTSRAANIQFQTLPNAVLDFVKSSAGLYATFAGDGTSTIEVAQQTLLTATALVKGNRALILNMPVDATGVGETRLFIGNLTANQVASSVSFTKTAQAPIQYNLQTAPIDTLVGSQHSEIIYKRYGG